MSGVEYKLDINEDEIGRFLTDPVNEKKINSAIERTLKKTMRWVGTQTARGLAKELDVLVKNIRKRVFYKFVKNPDGKGVKIWVGLNDLNAHSIGAMRQNKSGLSVKSHHFKGAFITKRKGSDLAMGWRRESSDHKNPDDEINPSKSHVGATHKKWPRYPLNKVGVHIKDDGERYLRQQERLIGERFNTILQQELNYEFYVKS